MRSYAHIIYVMLLIVDELTVEIGLLQDNNYIKLNYTYHHCCLVGGEAMGDNFK